MTMACLSNDLLLCSVCDTVYCSPVYHVLLVVIISFQYNIKSVIFIYNINKQKHMVKLLFHLLL